MRSYLKQCADFLKWSLTVALVVCACLLVAARILVNQLYSFQEALETWLENSLQVRVEAEEVAGSWQGVLPQIRLRGVSIGGEEPFIYLGSLQMEPDYLASIRHGTLVVRQMQVDDVRVRLEEDVSGRWRLGVNTDAGTLDVRDQLLDALMQSQLIQVSEAGLALRFYTGGELQVQLVSMKMENLANFHRFSMQGSVEAAANRFRMVLEMDDAGGGEAGANARAFLNFQGSDLASSLAILGERFGVETGHPEADDAQVNATVWLDFFADDRVDLNGQLELRSLPLVLSGNGTDAVDFQAGLAGRYQYGGQMRLDFIDPVVQLDQQQLSIFDFSVRHQIGAQARQLWINTDRFAIGELYADFSSRGLIPEGQLADILAELNPRGRINGLELTLDLLEPLESLRVHGSLDGLSLDALNNAPSVANVSGRFQATAWQGALQLDATHVSPHYQAVYDQPFTHERLTGTLGWQIDRDRGSIYVYAADLALSGPEGEMRGAFLVDSPLRAGSYRTDLTLMIALQNSSSEYWPVLAPRTLSADLMRWLESSVGPAAIPRGAFLFRGKLRREHQLERTIQLRLQLEDAELEFADNWPGVRELKGDLLVDNAEILVVADQARIRGIDLAGARVRVLADERSRVQVQTPFEGPGNQLLDLLRDTPARSVVDGGLDGLDLEGALAGQAELSFPLSASFPLEALQADIEADFQGNSLGLPLRDLRLHRLQGRLHYDDQGLWSSGFTASLRDRPVQFRIATDQMISIDLETVLSPAEIGDWLDLDLLNYWQGGAEVSGRIEIAGTDSPVRYLFRSDLAGISSDLPAPLGRDPDQTQDLELQLEQSTEHLALSLRIDGLLDLHMRWRDGQMDAVSAGLRAQAPLLEAGRLLGVVSLDQLHLAEWISLAGTGPENEQNRVYEVSHVDTTSGGNNAGKERGETGALLTAPGLDTYIEVSAQQSTLGGRELGPVHALVTSDQGWNMDFATTWGRGIYYFAGPSEDSAPLLHFTELDLDSWLAGDTVVTEPIDPAALPLLDVQIDQLAFRRHDFGRWQFRMTPVEGGVEVRDVSLAVRDVTTTGETGATRLSWRREDGQELTDLDLSLEFGNASQLFELIDRPVAFTSQRGNFYASFSWDGGPLDFGDQPMSGILGVELYNGVFNTQAQGVGDALMRVVGLLNINSWARRLQFDFSDVTARGTAFNSVRGDFSINQGVLATLTPVDANLSSGRMRFDGTINLVEDSVDAQLVAVLPLRENLTWLAGLVGGLPAAVGVWLVGRLFEEEVDNLTSVSYRISGSIDDPRVRTERVFDSTIRD